MVQLVTAENMIFSRSLSPCMENSQLSASLFKFTFTPDNSSMSVNMNGMSTAEGYVNVKVAVFAYGIEAFTKVLNPCEQQWDSFCPMTTKKNLPFNFKMEIDKDLTKDIPGMLASQMLVSHETRF